MENKFETLDRLEAAEEIDIQAWMHELSAIHMRRPARERAYKMVRIFYNSGKMSRNAQHKFIAWLTNGYETEAKEWALERVFEEINTKVNSLLSTKSWTG